MTDQADDEAPSASPIQKLREKAARADALEQELNDLRRDVALRDLGLTDTQRDALLAVHQGEATAEAYRATIETLNFKVEPQVPYEEQRAYEEMAMATAAAEPSEAHLETLEQLVGKAQTPEQVKQLLAGRGLLQQDW